MAGRRVDLQTAAELLGISSDAVRKRAKRGKIPYESGEDGRLYVWVDEGRTGADTGEDVRRESVTNVTTSDSRDELIATLKEQLEAERNAHAETRRIAYTLAQRVPELEAAQEPPQAPESAGEEPSSTGTPPPQHEPSERHSSSSSWWRRFLGVE